MSSKEDVECWRLVYLILYLVGVGLLGVSPVVYSAIPVYVPIFLIGGGIIALVFGGCLCYLVYHDKEVDARWWIVYLMLFVVAVVLLAIGISVAMTPSVTVFNQTTSNAFNPYLMCGAVMTPVFGFATGIHAYHQ